MKTIIFIGVIALAAGDSKYKLPKAPINDIANDTAVLKNLIDCLLDMAPCSEVNTIYKAVCDESIKQKCNRCTPYQKHAFWIFLQAMTAKFPEDYVNFRQKYDPENKCFQDLESELSKYSTVCDESIKQKCNRCTPYQKHAFWIFLQAMTAKFPEDYVNFRQKYDPENKYFIDLESELNKYSSVY